MSCSMYTKAKCAEYKSCTVLHVTYSDMHVFSITAQNTQAVTHAVKQHFVMDVHPSMATVAAGSTRTKLCCRRVDADGTAEKTEYALVALCCCRNSSA